eukprot:6178163-Pleurochrysis_carterae.AAC.2
MICAKCDALDTNEKLSRQAKRVQGPGCSAQGRRATFVSVYPGETALMVSPRFARRSAYLRWRKMQQGETKSVNCGWKTRSGKVISMHKSGSQACLVSPAGSNSVARSCQGPPANHVHPARCHAHSFPASELNKVYISLDLDVSINSSSVCGACACATRSKQCS